MGRARQTVIQTTKVRIRKGSLPKSTHICKSCGGRGWKYNTGRKG